MNKDEIACGNEHEVQNIPLVVIRCELPKNHDGDHFYSQVNGFSSKWMNNDEQVKEAVQFAEVARMAKDARPLHYCERCRRQTRHDVRCRGDWEFHSCEVCKKMIDYRVE